MIAVPASVTAEIGRRIAQAPALDDATAHHATRALIDWFGAMLAGWQDDQARMLLSALAGEIGSGAATVYSPGNPGASPRNAALLNGTASHVVEMDDIYSPALYHPGCPTVAAALALGEARCVSGAELLRAIAAGYEAGNRIGAAMQPQHYRFWHTTGTIGSLGAAAAGAAILQLDAEAAGHALAAAATFAAGLQQAFRSDSMLKPLHAGRAAEAGVLAALAAEAGLTGPPDMLEGAAGLGAAMAEGAADWAGMFQRWNDPPTVQASTVKLHACCGHTFAAIDGALALRETLRGAIGASDDIEAITVDTYSTAIDVAGNPAPASAFEARFSIAYGLAHALLHGSVGLDAFGQDRLADPRLRALLPRIAVRADPEIDRQFPGKRGARTTIRLTDGRTLTHHQDSRRGGPDYPVGDEELDAKFRMLAGPVLGDRTDFVLGRLRAAASLPEVDFLATRTNPTERS